LLDEVNEELWKGKEEIRLTPALFKLLVFFANNAGKWLHTDNLANNCQIWGVNISKASVRSHIQDLREQLGDNVPYKYIINDKKRGYRFVAEGGFPTNTRLENSSAAPFLLYILNKQLGI